MDPGVLICSVIQAGVSFWLGWGLRAHCKIEVDVDNAPESLLTRFVRAVTG